MYSNVLVILTFIYCLSDNGAWVNGIFTLSEESLTTQNVHQRSPRANDIDNQNYEEVKNDQYTSYDRKWEAYRNASIECSSLQPGQYFCADPIIDPDTQQAEKCQEEHQFVKVPCYPVAGIWCNDKEHNGTSIGFHTEVSCKWTNGKKFSTALLLSIFLGMFGIDRFYLGYPAIGLLKLCTLGFMFLGHLADVLLIALQIVGPSDGSYYIMDYFGAGVERMDLNNETYFKPSYPDL